MSPVGHPSQPPAIACCRVVPTLDAVPAMPRAMLGGRWVAHLPQGAEHHRSSDILTRRGYVEELSTWWEVGSPPSVLLVHPGCSQDIGQCLHPCTGLERRLQEFHIFWKLFQCTSRVGEDGARAWRDRSDFVFSTYISSNSHLHIVHLFVNHQLCCCLASSQSMVFVV